MDESILADLAPVIARHPWWQARTALVLNLLARSHLHPPATILDAGTGWGTTFLALEARGYAVTGLDVSPRALARLAKPGRTLVEADLTKDVTPDLPPFDAVLALDVIEHLDDDRAAVARLASLLRPGGTLILSVPALPDLFSEFDTLQGHRRRYLPETLRQACDVPGLELERTFWWGSWLIPPLRRQRAHPRTQPTDTPAQAYARYLTLPPWPLVDLLKLAFWVERPFALEGKLKRGTSLFAVARGGMRLR
jgi:SAM-dependent methyltransferase